MTHHRSKQTNSYEKIDELEQRIKNTEQDLEQSERVMSTVEEPEQKAAMEAKNKRRWEAMKDAKNRIDEEYRDINKKQD